MNKWGWKELSRVSEETKTTIKKNLPLGMEAVFTDGHGKIRINHLPEGTGSSGDRGELCKLRDALLRLVSLDECPMVED